MKGDLWIGIHFSVGKVVSRSKMLQHKNCFQLRLDPAHSDPAGRLGELHHKVTNIHSPPPTPLLSPFVQKVRTP